MSANPFDRQELGETILNEWQGLLNLAANLYKLPAALITRVDGNQIEIFLANQSDDNPYPIGCTRQFPNSGWYCEHTINKAGLVSIPDANKDPKWSDCVGAVEMHMVSYIGLPIERPDGEIFGTICLLDNKAHEHNELHIKLLRQINKLIELSLRTLFYKKEIMTRDRLLDNLSKIYPICSYCKKVCDEKKNWISIEDYVEQISGNKASHGVCPSCINKVIEEE